MKREELTQVFGGYSQSTAWSGKPNAPESEEFRINVPEKSDWVSSNNCKDNTSNDPFSRCATSNNYGYSLNWRWQDKVGLQHEENLDSVCVVTQHDKTFDTNNKVTSKTDTVHMKRDTWQVSVHVVFLLVRVVVIFTHCTPHRVAQVVRVSHVIHACSERHSSTLSSPFNPTSSSSHSPSISRSPCCSSSTSTRVVVTLRTPPTRRWVHWRVLPPHKLWAQELRPHGDLCRVPHRVPDLVTVLWATVSRGCGLRWHRARGDASSRTPRTCLSLPARRLVCRSVVAVRVRKNGETRCWENRETCCGKRSGAKRWKRTD